MKAVRIVHPGSFDGLMVLQEDVPTPGRREALIRIRAASLNYRDMVAAYGHYPDMEGRKPIPFQTVRVTWSLSAPAQPGSDPAIVSARRVSSTGPAGVSTVPTICRPSALLQMAC